jgi:glutamate-1-semialdehyde aminotransferase
MQDQEYISGTFGGEAVSLAAASATIDIYKRTGCIPKMHELGMKLRRDSQQILGPGVWFDGMPWKPRISAHNPLHLNSIVQGLAERGHLIHPKGFYISCAHDEDDVRDFVKALKAAQYDDPLEVIQPKGTAWLRS